MNLISIYFLYYIQLFKILHFSNLNIDETILEREKVNKQFIKIFEKHDKIKKNILYLKNITKKFIFFKKIFNRVIILFYSFDEQNLERKLNFSERKTLISDLNTFLHKFQMYLD
ncbi:hypothetical protein CWI36_0406p0010 [Hamiltosporidium magnivora]|uniref:Uncharacterized protein n=1 Tax=Hamiltosporidium magnivora TaxID=148818 RepID=A0A4V2JW57_9MICR|nr:hypothetical protein CWI36_0406p0010 [Hamiltosporidium magnivora]